MGNFLTENMIAENFLDQLYEEGNRTLLLPGIMYHSNIDDAMSIEDSYYNTTNG